MKLTITQYARSRRFSISAVRKALENGRFVRGDDGLLDSEPTDLNWALNARADKQRKTFDWSFRIICKHLRKMHADDPRLEHVKAKHTEYRLARELLKTAKR